MIPKSTPIYYCKKTCMCHGRIVIIILKSGKTDKFPEKVPVKIVRILEILCQWYHNNLMWAFCERSAEIRKNSANSKKSEKTGTKYGQFIQTGFLNYGQNAEKTVSFVIRVDNQKGLGYNLNIKVDALCVDFVKKYECTTVTVVCSSFSACQSGHTGYRTDERMRVLGNAHAGYKTIFTLYSIS